MLKTLITEQVLFYLAGGMLVLAFIAQAIVAVSLKRITNAAEDMGKSNHPLMKLVRAKFEHACMVNDKVQDVKAFVERYVHEYRVLGLRLYSWRRLSTICVWSYGILCILGAVGAYSFELMSLEISKYVVLGAGGILFMSVMHMLTDEAYRLKAVKIYMIDFLGNTYAHRYEKEKRSVKVPEEPQSGEREWEQRIEEPVMSVSAPVTEPEITKESQPASSGMKEGMDGTKEAKIREILEEFLT